MNIPVDIIASFDRDGAFRPKYIQLENKVRKSQTFTIQKILHEQYQKYAGIESVKFICLIKVGNQEKILEISYMIATHKWLCNVEEIFN